MSAVVLPFRRPANHKVAVIAFPPLRPGAGWLRDQIHLEHERITEIRAGLPRAQTIQAIRAERSALARIAEYRSELEARRSIQGGG